MLNNVTDVLSVVLTRHAGPFGPEARPPRHQVPDRPQGFLSASTLIGAAGVAWGIYDTLKSQNQVPPVVPAVPGVPAVPAVPPVPPVPSTVPADSRRH